MTGWGRSDQPPSSHAPQQSTQRERASERTRKMHARLSRSCINCLRLPQVWATCFGQMAVHIMAPTTLGWQRLVACARVDTVVKNHIDVMLVLDSKSRPQSMEWATVCFARQMFDLILPLFGRQRTRSTERAATRGKTVANTVVNGRTSGECSSDQLGGGNKVGTARMTVTMALHPNGFSFA